MPHIIQLDRLRAVRVFDTAVRLTANRLPLSCSAGVRFLPRLKAGVSSEVSDDQARPRRTEAADPGARGGVLAAHPAVHPGGVRQLDRARRHAAGADGAGHRGGAGRPVPAADDPGHLPRAGHPAAAVGLLLGVGGAVLGARLPSQCGLVALTFLLGTGTLFAVGLLIAALAPNGRTANGIGVLLYFPMAYLAGLMQPTHQMPVILVSVGEFTPLGAFRQSLQDLWAGGPADPVALVVMGAYAMVVSMIAARFFRWE